MNRFYDPPEDVTGTVFDPHDKTFGPIMAAFQSGDFEQALALTKALAGADLTLAEVRSGLSLVVARAETEVDPLVYEPWWDDLHRVALRIEMPDGCLCVGEPRDTGVPPNPRCPIHGDEPEESVVAAREPKNVTLRRAQVIILSIHAQEGFSEFDSALFPPEYCKRVADALQELKRD